MSCLPIFSPPLQSSLKSNKSKLHLLPKSTSKGLLSFPNDRWGKVLYMSWYSDKKSTHVFKKSTHVKIKSNELMLTKKLIYFITIPYYTFKFLIIHSTRFSLSQQRHVIQFERELRLESTTAWFSKLDYILLSHTTIKLNYLINYSLVYQIKR